MFEEFKRIQDRGLLLTGNESLGAKNEDGSYKKDNASQFIDGFYADRSVSDILTINRKIFDFSTVDQLCELHPFYSYLYFANVDGTLLSYYDNNNSYDTHRDEAIITSLTWFYEEPKKFEGGDFVIEEDCVIECKPNRTVFMPSYMLHAVTPVKVEEPNMGYGRYTMAQFINNVPRV